MTTKQKLERDIERNKISAYRIGECESILKELEPLNYKCPINSFLKKIGLKYRLFETTCTDGIHTDFRQDQIFMKDFKKAVENRKERLESHAKTFIDK